MANSTFRSLDHDFEDEAEVDPQQARLQKAAARRGAAVIMDETHKDD